MTVPPKTGSPNPAVAPPAEPIPVTPPNPAVAPPREHSVPPTNPVSAGAGIGNRKPAQRHRHRKSHPQQRTAPEPPAHDAPARRSRPSCRPSCSKPQPTAPVHRLRLLRGARPAKHLLRGRRTWLRSRPSSDRHRPCTYGDLRRAPRASSCATSGTRTKGAQVLDSDVLIGFRHLLRSGPRLVGQRFAAQSDGCPAGVVDFDVGDDVVNGLAAPHSQ